MTDFYAGAAQRWAEGAAIVYGPIAHRLLDFSPHPLGGRTILDAGSGTGVVSSALAELGARPIAADLSHDMLAWRATERPPAVVADVSRLPLQDDAVDDAVAAFVYNHLSEPQVGLTEAARVTRPGGAVLACVYANSSHSEVRDALDDAARVAGWRAPDWYTHLKQTATPVLGDVERMTETATRAGLVDVTSSEESVDVGVDEPEQLVDYRLGQAHFALWINGFEPAEADAVRNRLVDTIRPIMQPYRPTVVFLVARAR
ncbi:MAG: class I SAM-dependent methyltransferase [Mycobacteriales bacterium]